MVINVWVSSVRDVLFGRKGNGLGIYIRMSGVVALGSSCKSHIQRVDQPLR